MKAVRLPRRSTLAKAARGTAIGLGALAGAGALAALIFWDADVYAAREKWEHWKIAWFGEWTPEPWCPPGRRSKLCDEARDFTARLAGMEGFTFFSAEPVEGSDLEINTGTRFETAADVVSGTPAERWCYIVFGSGSVTQKLTLAARSGADAPAYADPSAIPDPDIAAIGLTRARLGALAQTHCRLGGSDTPNTSAGE